MYEKSKKVRKKLEPQIKTEPQITMKSRIKLEIVTTEKIVLSDLDKQMQKILNSKRSDQEKNEAI